jgi:outer membrane biosynthesis protein TonB
MAIRDTVDLLSEDDPISLLDTFRRRTDTGFDLSEDAESSSEQFSDLSSPPVDMPEEVDEQRRRAAFQEFYSNPENTKRLRENDDALAGEGVGVPRFRPSLREEFGIGLSRGTDQTQGLVYGFTGLLGQALGIEALEDYGLGNYIRKMEDAAQNQATIQDPFEDAEGASDLMTYAAGVVSEQIPQLLLSIGGAGIGGLVGKTVAKRLIANEVGKRTLAGMTKEKAAEEVAKKVSENALRNAGAGGGAYLANFGQIAGGSFGQIAQETGEGDALAAAAFAVPGAALDTLGEVFIAGKFIKPFTKTGRAAAEGVDTATGISFPGRVARSVGVGLPAASALEGGTEYVQTGLEQAALGAADPNRTIEEVVGTPEAERERRIAAVAGATVGGALGGAGSVIEALAPQTAEKLRQLPPRQTDQAPAEPGAALPGQWSQPVDVGGITMRKSASGIWAAINPPDDLDPAAPRNTLEDGSNVVVLRSAAGEQNAWLIEEAESALNEVSEGQTTDDLAGEETNQIADDEEELGEDAELQEIREGLTIGEEPQRRDLGMGQPMKSAEESARAIDDIYTEAERTGQSPFGALFQRKRADAENSRQRKTNERMLQWSRIIARKPDETKQFVDGLNPGDRVSIVSGDIGDENFSETTGVFVKRRPSGNAVFKVARLSPRSAEASAEQRARGETLVGPVQRIDITPDKFNRISLAPPPESRPLVSPFEETMRELLGTNPDKRSAGQALGSPFTGAGAPQETTISNRMGSGPIPVLVRWFNKKGEKGTVIPTFKGKFTNSPLTTVFQMNEGLGVEVPDDQLADLNPDIQVESVSNKKGGRKNIVTAVNLWGRTYRRGKTSDDFSVDLPLTSRGSKSKKRGLWLFDEIYRNAPERIAMSEAGRQAAETRQGGPLEEQLRRVAGNIAKLDAVENMFYQDDFQRATDFLENSNLSENEKRLAQQMAQDKVVLAYEKAARTSRGAPFRAEGRDRIAKRLTEILSELRAEELAQAKDKALTSIYGDVRGSKEIRSAQTRVNRLTEKALGSVRQQSPERSLEKLGTSQRSLTKNPNEVQKQAFEDLENFLEGQALSGRSREDIEKGILNRIEKGTVGMLNRAKTILEKEFTEGLKGKAKGDVVRAINQVADRYRRLGKFNPIAIATQAAFSAKRSIRRQESNDPTVNMTDQEAEQVTARQTPVDTETRQAAVTEELERVPETRESEVGQTELPEDSNQQTEEGAVAASEESDVQDSLEQGRDRLLQINDDDLDLVLRNRKLLQDERGRALRGQKSSLNAAQRRRALEIERFISGELNYEDIYPNAGTRGGDATVADGAVAAGRTSPGEVLSGASRSVARGTARTSGQRGPDRVGGTNQGAAGTVQGSPVQRDGGSGVPAPLDPQAVRTRARATTRRFVQSFARLTDAELTALSEAELDRARQAILNERDPAEALANRVAIGSTAASVADLARRSGLDLLRGAAAELATEQANRDAVNTARENLRALLKSGAFADANTFLDRVAATGSMPRDMVLRAREFLKLARPEINLDPRLRRGARRIDFNNVGIQIGRFGPDTSWAGLTTGADGGYNIAINLDAVHDRDSVVNTMLHELQHVVLKEKVSRRIPLNRVEQEALDRLEGIRRETVIRAARDRKLNVPQQPSDADVARLTKELVDLSDPALGAEADRALASLENLDEFVVEVSSNPELADLMVRLGFGEGKGKVTMLGALRNAWDALVQFITGIKADPNSPLAKAFKDSWMVTFANTGADLNLVDYTIPEVRRTAMADEMAKLAEIRAFIDARVEQENLAGTTEERNRFLAEWSQLNSNPQTAPARKARKQAVKKQKAQAKQAAEPEKKTEPPKKAETKKAEPPKKTETKKETPPKPPEVKKAVKTAKTKTVKPQSPAASENEFDEAKNTLSEDEWVKWLKQNGYALGDDAEYARMVYRSNKRNNTATPEQASGDTVQVSQSRARGRVWRSATKKIPANLGTKTDEDGNRIPGAITQGGMFAVDELVDKKAGDLYRSSRMAIKVDVATIQELSRLLERQMKTFFKGQTPPVETINTALGNLENPLTEEQITEIEQMRARGQTNAAAKKRDQYIRDNRRNFKQNKQTQALAQLPEELAATIREMSSHIESLSRRLPNEGLVNGDLAITVDEALGTYLNRSYAIFDDPQWTDRVRKDPKVMDAARKYIQNNLVKNKTEELIVNAAEDGRTLSRQDASALANDSVTEDEVENLLEGYLAVGQEAPTIEVLSGRIPGQKNLSLFYKRGNIAPEIQALWGRYEDPKINYAKTVMKLSSVIANDNFLKELRDLGIEEGWLWSRENNPDDTRHPPGYVRISTETNPTLAPLGGMYAHPMLAEGLFKMFPVGATEEHYWWLRSAMKLTGISMATKTVGSVASQIRNYLGNYLNLVATGNLGLRDLASGDFSRRFTNSTDTVLANTFNKYRNMSRAEWRAKIDDYIRRGIVGESITTGLLEDLLTASRRAGSPDFGDVVWNKVGEPLKKVADFAVRTYSAGDDWFKVMIYEAEQDKYRQAYPDWDDNKVKEKAAEIARDIHWTYSLAPAIVQDLKKFPFIAPFVTFTSEVIRTTYNLQKLARQEITEGRATGNKELEAIGWKRVRGMTTAAFLPLAVGSASMAMAGISGEDEEDLRRFLPDWQKNSQLLLFRKENGEVDFVDVSFLDPYEYFKKPLYAFMRSLRNADSADEILLKGTMDMVRQALDPFTSEQIFAGAIMDVMRNRDAAGRQVYNPQDTGANIGLNVARKIFYDPFVPGTVNSVERIGKAAFGIESETGRAYNLFNEIGSVTLGQRVSSVDAQQALQFKSSRFMREMRDASALFNREFTSQGTRSTSDVIDGYERSNAARRSLIDAIRRDYLASIRLGVPVQRAKAILRDGGLGGDTIKMVTTGIYRPYDASKQSIDLVRSRGKSDRISAYNQARRSAAPREILPDR